MIEQPMSQLKKSKRPLTPYNLFYRFKRGMILNACSIDNNPGRDTIRKLVEAPPGLEAFTESELRALHPKDIFAISRDIITHELKDNLLPFEGKRSHRKTHGALGFVEMNRVMCSQWKTLDASIKSVFQELADQGKLLYQEKQRGREKKVTPTYQVLKENDHIKEIIGSVEETAHMLESVKVHFSPSSPPFSKLINHESTEPSTFSPQKCCKLNIISPSSFESVSCTMNDSDEESSVSVIDDEFCTFIENNVHLVDTHECELDSFNFNATAVMPTSLNDLIDMDEMIEHCKLPF